MRPFLIFVFFLCSCEQSAVKQEIYATADSLEQKDDRDTVYHGYDEIIDPDGRKHLTVSDYNTDNPEIPNIKRPAASVIETHLDTSLLFGLWAHDPQDPHAAFDFNSHYIYYVDYDGNGAMPYELNGNAIKIYYNDFIWEGEIISVDKDTLNLRAKGDEAVAAFVRWAQ